MNVAPDIQILKNVSYIKKKQSYSSLSHYLQLVKAISFQYV